MLVSIPVALMGTILGGYVSPVILRTLLGLGLLAIALSFLKSRIGAAVRNPSADEHGRPVRHRDELDAVFLELFARHVTI